MTAATPNPVTRRLRKVAAAWEDFLTLETPRLARVLGGPDDRSLFVAWLEQESDEGGELPDFFLRFEAPFTDPVSYVNALREDFAVRMQEGADLGAQRDTQTASEGGSGADSAPAAPETGPDLAADFPEDFPSAWRPPQAAKPPESLTDAATLWLETCASFMKELGPELGYFGVYLDPDSVSDPMEWLKFLHALCTHDKHPEKLRTLAFDNREAPGMEPLIEAVPAQAATMPLDLGMDDALNEMAAEADDGSPGGAYRRHFTALATLASKGDLPGAEAESTKAIAIAEQEKWPALHIAALLSLAAAKLNAQQREGAVEDYGKAEKVAEQMQADGDPLGPKFRVQAMAGRASVRVSEGNWREARKDYINLAQVAHKHKDPVMSMEGWRMAGYCREQEKQWEAAFGFNGNAVRVAEDMTQEQRESSTLPFVGEALLRIGPNVAPDQLDMLKAYLTQLLPDWEERLAAATTPPGSELS